MPTATDTPTITPTATPAIVVIGTDNAASLKALQTWTINKDGIGAVGFLNDNQTVLSASTGGLYFTDAKTGAALRQQDNVFGTRLDVSPDGSLIALAGGWPSFGGLYLVDAATGEIKQQAPGPNEKSESQSVQFAPDGKSIIVGWQLGPDGPLVESWDFTGNHRIPLNTTRLYARYAPDGQSFVSLNGLYQKKDYFIHSSDGKVLKQILPPVFDKRWYFQQVRFTADGSQIFISAGLFQSTIAVELMTLDSGELVREYGTPNEYLLALSPDGKVLATSHAPDQVHLWNVETGEMLADLKGHTNIVTSGAFSPDGSKFVTGSDDASVIVWGLDSQ